MIHSIAIAIFRSSSKIRQRNSVEEVQSHALIRLTRQILSYKQYPLIFLRFPYRTMLVTDPFDFCTRSPPSNLECDQRRIVTIGAASGVTREGQGRAAVPGHRSKRGAKRGYW